MELEVILSFRFGVLLGGVGILQLSSLLFSFPLSDSVDLDVDTSSVIAAHLLSKKKICHRGDAKCKLAWRETRSGVSHETFLIHDSTSSWINIYI